MTYARIAFASFILPGNHFQADWDPVLEHADPDIESKKIADPDAGYSTMLYKHF